MDVSQLTGITLAKMIGLHLAVLSLYFTFSGGEASRPRGVAISKASFYDASRDFPCLDGSAVIPFDHINDDYCDCSDGSDEPGTSACPNGSFHCSNAGHLPLYIPSSRVNDAICDCCDGTDEYSGKVSCANYCLELGRHHREEQEKQRALLMEGFEVYKDYSFKGMEARKEKQVRLDAIKEEKAGLDDKRNELEATKIEAEKPETDAKDRHMTAWKAEKEQKNEETENAKMSAAFNDLDANHDNILSFEEIQAHVEFDIDANGEVSDEEAKEYLDENEAVNYETFSDTIWSHIKDIYKKSKENDSEPPEDDYDSMKEEMEDEVHPDPEEYDIDDEEDGDDDGDDDDDEDEDEYYDMNDNTDMPEYDEETKQLIAAADIAREAFDEVNNLYKELDKEISEIEDILNIDMGDNNEFYQLKGECYEYSDREYTYMMCPFSKCTQKNKHGGHETSLGVWGHWDEGEYQYASMKYEKGQNCWNGPDRSTKVVISCGRVNELVAASEPNKCEYEFQFHTPAACRNPPETIRGDYDRDEL